MKWSLLCLYDALTSEYRIVCSQCAGEDDFVLVESSVMEIERDVQHDKAHWNAHIEVCEHCDRALRLNPSYPLTG
jgi:hypothetical protein